MIGFGRTNPFPRTFGGGVSTKLVMRNAIKAAMSKWIDVDDVHNDSEAAGEAVLLALIWAVNRRLSNQGAPEKMIDNLAVWEESTGLRPTNEMTGVQRRAELAGKMRGQINNALVDIEDTASKVLGVNFDGLLLVDPVNVVGFEPGVNPGPPGYEWSSNRAVICIKMNKQALTEVQFLDLRDRLHQQLHKLIPAWMDFTIGVGDSFIANVGILGQTLL